MDLDGRSSLCTTKLHPVGRLFCIKTIRYTALPLYPIASTSTETRDLKFVRCDFVSRYRVSRRHRDHQQDAVSGLSIDQSPNGAQAPHFESITQPKDYSYRSRGGKNEIDILLEGVNPGNFPCRGVDSILFLSIVQGSLLKASEDGFPHTFLFQSSRYSSIY